jgi:hypothetical protein
MESLAFSPQRRRPLLLKQIHALPNLPNVLLDFRCHGRRHPHRLVNARAPGRAAMILGNAGTLPRGIRVPIVPPAETRLGLKKSADLRTRK